MFHVRPTRLIVIYSLYDRIIRYMNVLVYRRKQMFRSNGHTVSDAPNRNGQTSRSNGHAVTVTQARTRIMTHCCGP